MQNSLKVNNFYVQYKKDGAFTDIKGNAVFPFSFGELLDERLDEAALTIVNDTVVFNSNHIHAIGAKNLHLRYRYLIVDRTFCLENGFDTGNIEFVGKIKNNELSAMLDELYSAYNEPSDFPYRTLSVRVAVLKIMQMLCTRYSIESEPKKKTERVAERMKLAIEYIKKSASRDITLDEVATAAGINKFYLSHEFHNYTGYSFIEYLNYTRCKMAAAFILEGNSSIMESSLRAGFRSRSYFAKTFKRYVGCLPTEYKAK